MGPVGDFLEKKMPGRQTEVLWNDLYQHRLGAPEMGGLVGFFGVTESTA